MTKQLFLAPAGAGKTAYVLNLARQMAASLQAEVRVCVPTGLQAWAWRQRLAAAGGAVGVHVLTFDRLAAVCLNEAGEAYTELSEPVQYRLLRTIIDQLPLQHYAPLKAKPGFIQVTQQLISELKSAHVPPATFTQAVSGLGGEPRLRELAHIYTAYQDQLQAQGWADRIGLHWLAVEALSQHPARPGQAWPLLIIDGFDDFTPVQLALLRLLAGRASQFILTLPQADLVDYPRYRRTQAQVEAALGIAGQPLPPVDGWPARHPTLQHLARQLFALPAGEPAANEDVLILREAPDPAGEVRAALRWLKQRLVWDGLAPDQVALLARDIAPYRPFIRQVAAEFGLPIRLVDGLPLAQSPVIAALLALLRLHLPLGEGGGPDLPRRALIAAWRSPYFQWANGPVSITPAAADALDTLARQQRVIRGLGQWQAALDVTDGAALRPLFTHFLSLTRPPAGAGAMRDFVQWLETLIGPDPQAPGYSMVGDPAGSAAGSLAGSLHIVAQARQNPATAPADVAALRTLKDILRGLVWAEEAVRSSQPVDFAYFFYELSGAVAAAQYHLPGRAGQPQIMVASVIQVRGLSFAAAAIMGLSEGAFPATIREDPFLRDMDRRRLREQFAIALESSTQSAEREFFYEAVTRTRQKLLLTRPVLADNGAEWVASPFWEAARRLVAVQPELIPSEAVVPLAETASPAEWWETMATLADDPAGVLPQDAAILQQIQAAAHIWQARQAAEAAIWDGDLSSLAPELTTRYGPDYVWSASRLEAYQTCGFLFFLQKVLRLEPLPEPAEGLDSRQLGNLYHRIFEQVMRAGLPEPPTEAAVRSHVAAIAAPILAAAPAEEGFRETAWWLQTRQEMVDNVTRSLLGLADGQYEFFQAEAAFGGDRQGPPLIIRDGADQLRLRGIIDRIDRRADGRIRIIDYKSSNKAAYTLTAFRKGEKLQLPLYALAAEEVLGLGRVAAGFYWHFQQAEASSFTLDKAPEAVDMAVGHAWDAVRRIRRGQFAPRPPQEGCPAYCPAAGFCWHYSPKEW